MTFPAQVIDLRNFKLTLPIGSKNKPTEVKQPALATFSDPNYFHVSPDGKGVVFRAPVNGVTTSGSSNPRSELREMPPGGDWSSTDGKTHTLIIDQAFNHMPNPRTDSGTAGVVGGQIHNARDDVSVFRCEGSKLWVTNGNNTHFALADGNYSLGARVQCAFVVADGKVSAFYNGELITTIAAKFSGAYFKSGAYVQANASNSKPADSSNFGEVTVYGLTVAHGAAIPIPAPGTVPPPVPTPVPVPTPTPAPTAQSLIFIQRHAEKDDNADGVDDVLHGLSAKGRARALAIRDRGLFITPRADLAVPTYVLASQGGRMEQTAKPTADVLKLPIDVSLDVETATDAAAKLLVAQAKAGFIVWAVVEHKGIPALLKATAKLLGCTDKVPSSHADADFHTGYTFKGAKFSTWQESVLPGDPGYVAVPPPVVTPPPVVVPPVPQFPDAAWWSKYAPKGGAVFAACAAAVAAVLITFGVACGADCPSPGPVTPPVPASTPAPTPTPTSTPVPTTTPTSTPAPPPGPGRAYPWHTNIVATTFWVGELFQANAPDGSQVCSTYDSEWALHYSGVKSGAAGPGTDCEGSPIGGCDGVLAKDSLVCTTETRTPDNGWFPKHMTPLENPFYVDLPFDDLNNAAARKQRDQVVPWANDPGVKGSVSYLKNRWVEIIGASGRSCFAQNEDAGPGQYNDARYVFGTDDARPLSKQYNGAGMDASPAVNGCAGFKDLDGDQDRIKWRWVDPANVPDGPWKRIVTISPAKP